MCRLKEVRRKSSKMVGGGGGGGRAGQEQNRSMLDVIGTQVDCTELTPEAQVGPAHHSTAAVRTPFRPRDADDRNLPFNPRWRYLCGVKRKRLRRKEPVQRVF